MRRHAPDTPAPRAPDARPGCRAQRHEGGGEARGWRYWRPWKHWDVRAGSPPTAPTRASVHAVQSSFQQTEAAEKAGSERGLCAFGHAWRPRASFAQALNWVMRASAASQRSPRSLGGGGARLALAQRFGAGDYMALVVWPAVLFLVWPRRPGDAPNARQRILDELAETSEGGIYITPRYAAS